MKKIVLVFFAVLITGYVFSQESKWYTISEALELTKKEPRLLVIDVYTDWCKYCKVMDANTFSNKVISEYMNLKYYPVKFNAEQKENITINDQTFKFVSQGTRGYHELAAALLNGNLAYPSIVFLSFENNQISIVQLLQGYYQAKDFDAILKFIGEEKYKNETWEQFMASYQSPIQE